MADNKDVASDILKGLNVNPAEAQKKVDTQNTVDSFLAGVSNVGPSNEPKLASTKGDTSIYDIGYSPGEGPIDEFRAVQQTGADQFGNRLATAVPNIGLGIVELGGHILDSPDNVYGLVSGGMSMDGTPNNFDNIISKWARETAEELPDLTGLKVYRENPNKTIDLGDTAFWMNAGFDTAESITEFMLTGMGVGSAVGAVTKGISLGAKALMGADMIGTALKGAEKLANYGGKVANSLITSQSVAALNASQTYKGIIKDLENIPKEDGTAYSEEEINGIASKAAASTYQTTLALSTALNYTSLSPFAKQTKSLGISSKVKESSKYLDELKKISSNKTAIENGTTTFQKVMNQLRPGGVVGEMAQEGVEEVTENLAQEIGEIEAKQAVGMTSNAMDLTSPENTLAFSLGALGGGMAKGIGSAYTKATGGVDKTFEDTVNKEIAAVENHMTTSAKLSDLYSLDLSDKKHNYGKVMNEINDLEIGLMANAITHGLDNGTYRILQQEIENLLSTEDDAAEAGNIDKDKLKNIPAIIEKHKKLMDNLSSSPQTAKSQRYAIKASLTADMLGDSIQRSRVKFDEVASSYTDSGKRAAAAALSMVDAYSKIEEPTKAQQEAHRLLQEEINGMDLSETEISALKNDNLNDIASSMVEQINTKEASETSFEKLNNKSTSEQEIARLTGEEIINSIDVQRAAKADAYIAAAEEMFDKPTATVAELDASVQDAKSAANAKGLTDVQKEAHKKKISSLENLLEIKKTKIREKNSSQENLDEAPESSLAVAEKMTEGYDPTQSERDEALESGNNLDDLVTDIKVVAVADEAEMAESKENIGDELDVDTMDTDPGMDAAIAEDIAVETTETLPDTQLALDKKGSEASGDTDRPSEKPNPTSEVVQKPTEEDKISDAEPIDTSKSMSVFQKETVIERRPIEEAKELRESLEQKLNSGTATKGDAQTYHELKTAIEKAEERKQANDSDISVITNKRDKETGEMIAHTLRNDDGVEVSVFEIFELAPNGDLAINTPAISQGDNIEVVLMSSDPRSSDYWPYHVGEGNDPILIFSTKGGKRSAKPIAELPFDQVDELNDYVRRNLNQGGKTKFSGKVNIKGYGDVINEWNQDGTKATNSLGDINNTSGMPLTITVVNEDGKFDIKGISKDQYTDAQWNAIIEFKAKSSRQSSVPRPVGSAYMLMTAPNGKIFPAMINAKTLSGQDVARLTSNDSSEGNNIAKILDVPSSNDSSDPNGLMKLKQLMGLKSAKEHSQNGKLGITEKIARATDQDKMFATPNSLLWKTDAITNQSFGIPAGSWIKIDFRISSDKVPVDKRNPLNSMLNGKSFRYSVINGETNQRVRKEGQPANYSTYFDVKPGDELHKILNDDLKDVLSKMHYNVSKRNLNDTSYLTNAFGETPESSNYNDQIAQNFTTSVTSADKKFANVKFNVKIDDDLQQPIQKPAKAVKAKKKRVQIAEETQPTKSNPNPDLKKSKKQKKT
jgi:hypothetical protein